MLRELHIANLALIEDLAVHLGEGFTVFTGQTGAGKSLIIGAFETLLCLRNASPAELLRPGADEARISGLFELHDAQLVAAAAAAIDQPLQPGEQLLITRKLFASGRSSTSINGQPATAAMVKRLAELLVDIHGQHEHQHLLHPSNQLDLLDSFAGTGELRRRFAAAYAELRDLRAQRDELVASQTLRAQQLELYEFQAGELDAAEVAAGELTELDARHRLLSNLAKIQRQAGAAHAALHEADGSVVERLEIITHGLLDLTDLDESLAPIAEQVKAATLTLKEASFDLSRYLDRLEVDGGELAEVEQRLNLLNRLVDKYARHAPIGGGDGGAALLAFRADLGRRIDELRAQNADQAGGDRRIVELSGALDALARELTGKRRKAAAKLKPLIEAELAELSMGEAKFAVEIEPLGAEGDAAGAFVPSGADRIEMMVQTNPGQPARPLRKIASGGEMSRVMLALKSILSGAGGDRVSVLIFDEIDANIGGRLGSVIGRKLRRLATPAKGRAPSRAPRAQVLCITHLPQIAAFADKHLKIAKRVTGKAAAKQTFTTVAELTGEARVDELAEMMAGKAVTPTTRAQAVELLAAAA